MKPKTWKLSPSKRHPGWYALIGPYDPDFVESLKDAVDPQDREWDPVAKLWRVRAEVLDDVRAVIDEHTESPAPAGAQAAAGFLDLLEGIGPSASDAELDVITEGLGLGASELSPSAKVIKAAGRTFVDDHGRRCLAIAAVVALEGS